MLLEWKQCSECQQVNIKALFSVRPSAGEEAERSQVLGWELSAIVTSPPDLQEESAGQHSEVKNQNKSDKNLWPSACADSSVCVSPAPILLLFFLSCLSVPFLFCPVFRQSGTLINGLTSWCGLSLEWPAVVTLSHGHTHLFKWGSWPPSLKCLFRDQALRRMAVGVWEETRGRREQWGRRWGVRRSGICGWAHVGPCGSQVVTKEST